jgi:ATP-dependent helicase HrpA
MLKEKVHLLLKSLPQKLRRHCVPLPDYAARFCERVQEAGSFGRGDLIDAIIADIRAQITISVLTSDFKPETLPAHHFMNFKVIDEHGRQLDMGRNLATLQAEFGTQARESFQKMAEANGGQGVSMRALSTSGGKVPRRRQCSMARPRPRPAGGEGRRCR